MITIEELSDCYDLVFRYRRELEAHWPTPDPIDSLRFAQTEIAEAQDAWLRSKIAYKRNHQKTILIADELTQAALMVLTSLGPHFDWNDPKVSRPWVYWQKSLGTVTRNGYNGSALDWASYLIQSALQEALWPKGIMDEGGQKDEETWYFTEFCGLQALVLIGQMKEVSEGFERGLYTRLKAELERIKKKHAKE